MRLWASGMLERKTVKYKFNLTAVALANKVARIVFVLMTRGGQYDPVGRSQPERTRAIRCKEFSPPGAISIEGADEVMWRTNGKGLEAQTPGQRQYERERMMRQEEPCGQIIREPAETSLPHQQAVDIDRAARDVHNSFKATLDHGAPSRHDRNLRIPAEDRGDVKRPSGALAANIHEPGRQSGCTRDARSSLSRGTTLCGDRRARAGRSTRR